MQFYVGLHQPSDAQHFDHCMISVNRLRRRRKPLGCGRWLLDSGAFTELYRHGRYRHSPAEYAAQIDRLSQFGILQAAASQDYMCEPFILDITGLSIADHQRLTIERYDTLRSLTSVYVLPVLQGYAPSDYVAHLAQYGERLASGAWVGVGSVCKRNSDMGAIEAVLIAIKTARPDLRLHGFGVKTTALQSSIVRELLFSADSMAWSYAARRQGRSANDWREAKAFAQQIAQQRPVARGWQYSMF